MLFESGLSNVKKLIASVFALTIILLGIIMLITPGPGILFIALGLIILAGEFVWAKKLLKKFNNEAEKIVGKKGRKVLEKLEKKLEEKE